jgi:histidyl-tRNA synthetase
VAKQFQHADKRGIPFAIVVGEQEIAGNIFAQNLESGEQVSLDFEGLKKICYNSVLKPLKKLRLLNEAF